MICCCSRVLSLLKCSMTLFGSGNDMVFQRLGQTLARVSETVPF
jgi:hypothetical protein